MSEKSEGQKSYCRQRFYPGRKASAREVMARPRSAGTIRTAGNRGPTRGGAAGTIPPRPLAAVNMRLLLVEDYRPMRESLAKGLRETGFAVDATGDGEEGLWYALGNNYDVIILDLMLPGLDGLSILKKLRAEGRQSHVLILTAKDTVDDRITGLDLGADDYLVKPFAFRELLARVRALVRRSYRAKNPRLEVQDLRIDLTLQRVWRGGEEIGLTPREYALLEYLALRAGQVVSRTDIWEHVYEFNSSASSNVVDVYIGYLRRKIDPPGRPSLINTIRGRGYLLGAES
jgi:DNA-binding response OmpR family regulator